MSIRSIKHKGLQTLFEKNKKKGVSPELTEKLQRVLSLLDVIKTPQDLDGILGLHCHRLVGNKKGFYSILISKNKRIIFRMHKEDVYDVDFTDYH